MFTEPRRIEIKYSADAVRDMLLLLKTAPFPDKPPIDSDTPWKFGIDFEYLKELKSRFETTWTWETLEKKIAKFKNYIVHYKSDEGDELDLHYVHVRSSREDAIPLILLHGWPGTFFDFHKVIDTLVNPPSDLPAFHVVVPSIPGFFLSTLPRRDGWSLPDIAKVYNGLMTEVLKYPKYTGQGGDWGSMILRYMDNLFPESVTRSHYNMFVTPPPFDTDQSDITEYEKALLERTRNVATTGMGYFAIQRTKPFTIGIAIASSPLAILAYIGEKIYTWSDPELVDPQDILDTVALYYLSGCFPTSVVIYNQSHIGHDHLVTLDIFKKQVKNKFGYSAFPYEALGQRRSTVARFGNLAFYKEHKRGGHFPALDVPEEYVEDLREFFGEHWNTG